jgi:predicted Zn-dependent protease with MMP-like domain
MGSVNPPSVDWAMRKAPSLADFETLAESAFLRLPKRFLRYCNGLVIQIEDFPDEETLDEMGCESEFELLGLFRGKGMTQGDEVQTGQFPNMVYLYRRPILDAWAESEELLGDLIRHVLIHEIGHHFGLSDEDMETIEREAD